MSFAPPAAVRAFAAGLPSRVTLLADPELRAYRALGLGRASFARVWLDVRVWVRYAALLCRGRRPGRVPPGQDARQLGGDVVLDANLRVRWLYRSRGPEDRPPAHVAVRRLREAAGVG